jgi:acylphosphatase
MKSVRVRIEGRVQGVGFRAWVEANATGLGLAGWVANRRDGGVEASFTGPAAAVDDMLARCRHGPRTAAVAMVKALEETEPAPTAGFEVRPTR